MFISIDVHPMVGVQFLITVGKALSAQWWVSEGSYSWSIISSIIGPSLYSVLPRTILPMDTAMVSRYTDPVESSRTIPMGAYTGNPQCHSLISWHISRGPSIWSCGSGIFVLVTVSVKPQVSVEGHLTASILVGGDTGMVGAPGKWVDSRVEIGWGKSALQPGPPILLGNSNGDRYFLPSLSWGTQHPAEYSCRGWPAAVYGPIHLKTLQYVSFGNHHKFTHGLTQFSYTPCQGVGIWACQQLNLFHPML